MLSLILSSRYYLAAVITMFSLCTGVQSSSLTSTVDEWLDPALKHKKQAVVEVISSLTMTRNPPRHPAEDYGFTNNPCSKFDWQWLRMMNVLKDRDGKRPCILDMGCGLGHMTLLSMFAGVTPHAVDFKETVTLANANIFNKTKDIIGYTAKQASQFYRACPSNMVAPEEQNWMKMPHAGALCKDVVHLFTESELTRFASRLFTNLEADGPLYIQADTPFYSEECLAFYKSRQATATLCPGLAVYNKLRGTNGLGLAGTPVPLDEVRHQVRPGTGYDGRFLEDGTTEPDAKVYHTVRNLFLKEDLSTVFQKAGFKLITAFYLDNSATMIPEGQLPEVGKPVKVCVLMVKA